MCEEIWITGLIWLLCVIRTLTFTCWSKFKGAFTTGACISSLKRRSVKSAFEWFFVSDNIPADNRRSRRKLRQLDKGIVADVLEVLCFITAQRRLGKVGMLLKLFQRQSTLHTQVFQSFLYGYFHAFPPCLLDKMGVILFTFHKSYDWKNQSYNSNSNRERLHSWWTKRNYDSKE